MDESHSEPELTPAEWELVKELVYQWETDQPADLMLWLTDRCPNAAIRQEVERLVRASATSGNFMQGKAGEEHLGVAAPHPVHIGRYRVIEELGHGGLGVVYAAYDQALDRKVALKVLADRGAGPEPRKRLRWDAKAATAAKHPNIVAIYDIANDGGLDYIVMECVDGQNLSKILGSGPLPTAKALDYALQIAKALEVAHRSGIVHRDLKPSNIMINEAGEVKILDFGLAKQEDIGVEHSSMPATIEGHFAGTVAYVSPEQAEGKPVDARGDVFSFGCILFEMLTGKQAFQGNTPFSVLGSILHLPTPVLRRSAPHVDERFEIIVQGCLKKKAADRFAGMAEVKSLLTEIVETGNNPTRLSGRTRRWISRAAIGVGFAAVVLLGGLWLWGSPAPVQFDQILITMDTALATSPAISRNGQLIAYASDSAGKGNLDLYLRAWDVTEVHQITNDGADAYSPSFSPDAAEVVYRSEKGKGGLYKTPFMGGASTLLAPQGRDGRFSPDGKWIAYWTGEVGGALITGSARTYVVPSNGGPAREFPLGFDVAAYPIWAADENKLMFLGRRTGEKKGDWWVADFPNGAARPIGMLRKTSFTRPDMPTGSYFPRPGVWLLDGRILFCGSRRDANNIWSVYAGGRKLDTLDHWTDGTDMEADPDAVTLPTGSIRTVYAALTESSAIWQIPLKPDGNAAGAPRLLVNGLYRINSPSLSSDGRTLAVSSKQPRGTTIQLADLSLAERVQPKPLLVSTVTRVVLSGDGETVAWRDENEGYIMRVKDDSAQQICTDCGQPTQLSFDGKRAIFEAGRSPGQDLLLCVRGKQPRNLFQITGGPHWLQASGRFSPDEKWLAFTGWQEGEAARQLVIVPVTADGAVREDQVVQLTHDRYHNLEPVWSPDGSRIYFLSDRDGHQCVWALNVDRKSARPQGDAFPVSHFHGAARTIRGPAPNSGSIGLSAAKDFLVLTLTDTKGSIWARATRPN